MKINNLGSEELSQTLYLNKMQMLIFFLNDELLIIENESIRPENSNTSYPFTDNLKALLNVADIIIIKI